MAVLALCPTTAGCWRRPVCHYGAHCTVRPFPRPTHRFFRHSTVVWLDPTIFRSDLEADRFPKGTVKPARPGSWFPLPISMLLLVRLGTRSTGTADCNDKSSLPCTPTLGCDHRRGKAGHPPTLTAYWAWRPKVP